MNELQKPSAIQTINHQLSTITSGFPRFHTNGAQSWPKKPFGIGS
jgi:hypothetical protein